jgi:methyltransferase (TIGR00027 family)
MTTADPTADLDPVATTARLTAAMRAEESARPDRLVDDPLAATLAGDAGRALLDHVQVGESIPVRTHHFDALITAVAGAGVRQIVLIAAGMDSRAYRLDLPPGTTVYELDRPALLRLKAELLADAPAPRSTRIAVEVDLTADWPPALTAAGFDRDAPTCWLAEGLLQYLTEADVHGLLDTLTGLSAPGSHLVTDIVGRSLLDSPATRPMLEVFARHGMPWTYGTDEPEELFTTRGWVPDVRMISTVGTALGRWPHPDAPRGTPGVPNGFLVHATR